MSLNPYLNEPINAIEALLENSKDGIIGIRIPRGDENFTPEGFGEYMNSLGPSAIFPGRLDVRGPFANDFETSVNGKPRRDIFYIGIGNNIMKALEAYLSDKAPEEQKKANIMFATVLRPYPVYTIGKKYAGATDHDAHSPIPESDTGEDHE